MGVSVIIPIFNEEANVALLYDELTAVMGSLNTPYELLFVDDGSRDGSYARLTELAHADDHVRILRFRGNFGQTAALQAGLEHATESTIVTIDGDLQNDPTDIPRLLECLDQGYDLAHGWRRNRQDAWLSRTLPSRVANRFISWATGFPIHDLGCTLKAMRREIADEIELYGQMHRFIPILAATRGARCVEVVTHHRPRRFGTSKYGLSRTLQVLLDLCTVTYVMRYFANPMRLFGKLAAMCSVLGMVALSATLVMKWSAQIDMSGNPLLLLSVFCLLTSTQLVGIGLLGEVNARLYYRKGGHRPFAIGERVGYADEPIGSFTSADSQAVATIPLALHRTADCPR